MTMHVSVANSHRIQVTDKVFARATVVGLVIDGRKSYRGESVDNRTWQTLADLRAFLALTDKWAKEAAQQRAEEKARQAAKATEPQDDDKPQPVTEAWTLQDSGATQQWVRITVRERDARHPGYWLVTYPDGAKNRLRTYEMYLGTDEQRDAVLAATKALNAGYEVHFAAGKKGVRTHMVQNQEQDAVVLSFDPEADTWTATLEGGQHFTAASTGAALGLAGTALYAARYPWRVLQEADYSSARVVPVTSPDASQATMAFRTQEDAQAYATATEALAVLRQAEAAAYQVIRLPEGTLLP